MPSNALQDDSNWIKSLLKKTLNWEIDEILLEIEVKGHNAGNLGARGSNWGKRENLVA